jgi:hypothetical protein
LSSQSSESVVTAGAVTAAEALAEPPLPVTVWVTVPPAPVEVTISCTTIVQSDPAAPVFVTVIVAVVEPGVVVPVTVQGPAATTGLTDWKVPGPVIVIV